MNWEDSRLNALIPASESQMVPVPGKKYFPEDMLSAHVLQEVRKEILVWIFQTKYYFPECPNKVQLNKTGIVVTKHFVTIIFILQL